MFWTDVIYFMLHNKEFVLSSCQVSGTELLKTLKFSEWEKCLCYANEMTHIDISPTFWNLERDYRFSSLMWPMIKPVMPPYWNPIKNSGHESWLELPVWWTHWWAERVPCPSLVQETYPDSAKSTPLFLSPSLLLLSSSFLLSFLFSCIGLIFFRRVYGLDELLQCLLMSQLPSPLWCQTLCFSGEGDKQSSFIYQEQPLCTPVSFWGANK